MFPILVPFQYCSVWDENLGQGRTLGPLAGGTCRGHPGGGRHDLHWGRPVGSMEVNETSWSLRWGQAEAKLSESEGACRDGGLPSAQIPGRLNAQKAFPGLEPKEAGSEGNRVYSRCIAAEELPVPCSDWLQIYSGLRVTRAGVGGTWGLAKTFCSAWQGLSLTWSGPWGWDSWCSGNDSASQLGRSSGWSRRPLEPVTAGSGVPLQVFPVVARGQGDLALQISRKKMNLEKEKGNWSRMAFRSLATNLRARPRVRKPGARGAGNPQGSGDVWL